MTILGIGQSPEKTLRITNIIPNMFGASDYSLSYFKRMGLSIAAAATSSGGPVQIIRFSGHNLDILSRLCGALPKAGTIALKKIKDNDQKVLDEAVVLYFKNPHSFTGEDVLEFQIHGVDSLKNKILEEAFKLGIVPALPGEFSFRALKNGKMSLEEAEALHTAISSESLDISWAQKLLGCASNELHETHKNLDDLIYSVVQARGRVEAAIDFSEAESEQEQDLAGASEFLLQVEKKLSFLLSSYDNFCLESGEPRVVIVGKPNVGKSTLLNILVGGKRALVSPIAGTTRDVVETRIRLTSGRWIRLLDTAGIRFHDVDQIEREGISLGMEAASKAQMLIYLSDARGDIDLELKKWLQKLESPVVYLHSHNDIAGLQKTGAFDLLTQKEEIKEFVFSSLDNEILQTNKSKESVIVSSRQAHFLGLCQFELTQAKKSIEGSRPLELCGEHLKEVEKYLKMCKGQDLDDAYIGAIFSQFCLGK